MSSEHRFSLSGKRVWVAGHGGMVGSALVRRLEREDCEILGAPRADLDLRDPARVRAFVRDRKPDAVMMAAARVGGILANAMRPADFLHDNLMIAANIAEAAFLHDVGKMLFLGSSCIYPRLAPQPIREAALLTGPLEPTNEPYAVAKIAGVKLLQAYRRQYGCDFISVLPTNLYGPGDNFDLETSHVLPALIRKAHDARISGAGHITVWGTGAPRREFLHADDCADACVFLMQRYSDLEPVNIGAGTDLSILELARLVCEIVGFHGEIRTDPSRPSGTPRKRLDTRRLDRLGWRPRIDLRSGVARTYADFAAAGAGG